MNIYLIRWTFQAQLHSAVVIDSTEGDALNCLPDLSELSEEDEKNANLTVILVGTTINIDAATGVICRGVV